MTPNPVPPTPAPNPMEGLAKALGPLMEKLSPDQLAGIASLSTDLKRFTEKQAVIHADIQQVGANILVLNNKLDELLRRTSGAKK